MKTPVTIEGAEARIRDVRAERTHGRDVREVATVETVGAIRRLERLLGEALGGEKLRGCPNLVPDWNARAPSTGQPEKSSAYFGYRLRGEPDTPLDAVSLSAPIGRAVLVVNDRGRIRQAFRVLADDERRYVEEREAEDSVFRTGDLVDLLCVLEEALPRHVSLAQEAKGRHVQAGELAKLVKALADDADSRGLLR